MPKEWYEILNQIARKKHITLSNLIAEISKSTECLGLPYISSTQYKQINVSIEDKQIEWKIEKFLFCN